MTERVLLAVSATIGAINGVLLGAGQFGVEVPGEVLLFGAIAAVAFSTFCANFLRPTGGE